MTSPSAWPRSRPRSSAARRSCSTTTRWSAASSAAAGRPLPAAVPGRPVLPGRALARAQGDPGVPPVADPGQGRLRHQGRARLPASRRLRPSRVRQPDRLAVRRSRRHARRCGSAGGSPGRSSATSAATARCARRGRRRPGVPHALRQRPPADRLGARAWASTPGSSARPSWPMSCASGSNCWSSATPASRRSRRPGPPPGRPGRTPTAAGRPASGPTATAITPRARSGPSASPGWSRWPAS